MSVQYRYLLSRKPRKLIASATSSAEILQAFFSFETGMHILREDDHHYLIIESLKNSEEKHTKKISKWAFDQLCEAAGNRWFAKTRYTIDHGGFPIFVDVFRGRHEGLILLTHECASLESAQRLILPRGLVGKKVSRSSGYRDFNLAHYGVPK